MKTRLLLPFLAALLCASTVHAGDDAVKGLAAECVACARSCPQKCVPKGQTCICPANQAADCDAACERSNASDAAALERCRSQCREKGSAR